MVTSEEQAVFLSKCKGLAGDTSDVVWTPDHLAGFFQAFRPDGERIRSVFAGIPAGEDVFRRLREVYSATAAGSQRPHTTDAYFIVRSPKVASDDELARLATAQLSNWRQMAVELSENELVDLLTPIPSVRVSTNEPPALDPNDTESLDVVIYDVDTDWHGQLIPLCPHASWMQEAFYYINCDFRIARYVDWPWYMNSSSIKEAYKPYFRLWLSRAELRCESPDRITVFRPQPED